jgi:hypothetical protein
MLHHQGGGSDMVEWYPDLHSPQTSTLLTYFHRTFKEKCLSDPVVGFKDMVVCVHAEIAPVNDR